MLHTTKCMLLCSSGFAYKLVCSYIYLLNIISLCVEFHEYDIYFIFEPFSYFGKQTNDIATCFHLIVSHMGHYPQVGNQGLRMAVFWVRVCLFFCSSLILDLPLDLTFLVNTEK
jgi:hypothetical protein